jgi:hypothetical protein
MTVAGANNTAAEKTKTATQTPKTMRFISPLLDEIIEVLVKPHQDSLPFPDPAEMAAIVAFH